MVGVRRDAADVTYRCLTGHVIEPEDLDTGARVELMDGRAEVRICVEHGAPIAVTRTPSSPAPQSLDDRGSA